MSSFNENIHIIEPNISSSSGAGTVGYSIKTESLETIFNDTNKDTNTEMIMAFLKRYENIKTKVLEEPKFFKIDARITLDYWEDYIFMECLRIFCGNNASREDIHKFLEESPKKLWKSKNHSTTSLRCISGCSFMSTKATCHVVLLRYLKVLDGMSKSTDNFYLSNHQNVLEG